MTEITKFEHKEFGKLRTVSIDGEPWFIGKEVAEKLGYKDVHKAIKYHVDEEDRGVGEIPTPSGIQKMTIINESGVYSLVIGSKLESAKRFKRWITSEVLPSLRKYGSYSIVKPDSYMIEDKIERAKRWIEEEQERVKLEMIVKEKEEEIEKKDETLKQQEPLVHFAKTVASTEDCIDMNNMAKLIGQKTGISVGRNKLFAILRNNKFLMYDNQPYQKYIEDGTFSTLEYTYMKNGEARIGLKTLVTGKGQIKICRFVKRYAENLLANCSVSGKD